MKVFAAIVVLGLIASSSALPRNLKMWPVRIVGGEEATPHELPYQVSLEYFDSHICGGSVLNANTIITAAHCCDVGSGSSFSISAGRHNLDQTESTAQTIDVTRKIMHEDYNANTIENDICLLVLNNDLTMNANVQAIALPEAESTLSGNAVVSGWGTTSQGGQASDVLMKVTVPIMTDAVCRESYGSELYDSMICAGLPEGGKDSCQGDSGGPLAITVSGEHVLAGIVSWGYGCAQPDAPGVYTETSHFIDWIDAQLKA